MSRREVGVTQREISKFYRDGNSKILHDICNQMSWDYEKAKKLTKNIKKSASTIGQLHEALIELGIEENK